MTWFTASSVSVNNGQSIVSINTTADDIGIVQEESMIFINGIGPGWVKRGYLDGGSNKKLELYTPWEFGNQVNQPAKVIWTDGGLAKYARILQEVGEDSVTFAQAMAQIISSTEPTINIETKTAGTIPVTPYGRLTQDYDQKVSDITIIARDAYRTAVEASSGGKNTVIYDAQGNPNIMVVVPRFNYEDLNLPLLELGTGTPTAFLTNGVPRSEILIAKYLASTPSGTSGCSVIGGVQPRTSVTFDAAKNLCVNKGNGWHLMSQHEWAAIALWCLANGTVPRGNTFYGRSHEQPWETARRDDNGMPGDTAGTPRTDTGKGPRTWTHDHTDFGIHDLVGNCLEWVDQFKLVDGQIITTPDNNPALTEAVWTATGAFYDAISASGGAPRLANSVSIYQGTPGDNQNTGNNNGVEFSALTKDPGYTPQLLLRRLLAETASSTTVGGRMYTRNFGERPPLRGGYWANGATTGLGALNLNYSRASLLITIGFRPAFFV